MVRTTGSKSFTHGETDILLELVEKMRPLHKQRWDEVAAAYNDHIAGKDFCARDADALKRRFMVLAYAKKPSEEWREAMDRATTIHQSILEEAGAAVINLGMGGLTRAGDTDGMLLLTEGEAELVNSTGAGGGYDEDYPASLRYSSGSITITPVRTGKRGRPPGSTTGSAAKRVAHQAEQVFVLTRAVMEIQKQLRDMREALATVVETQTNQSAVLAVLQQQLQQDDLHGGNSVVQGGGLLCGTSGGDSEDVHCGSLDEEADDDEKCHQGDLMLDATHSGQDYQQLLA